LPTAEPNSGGYAGVVGSAADFACDGGGFPSQH
jgi:hypothetical protein